MREWVQDWLVKAFLRCYKAFLKSSFQCLAFVLIIFGRLTAFCAEGSEAALPSLLHFSDGKRVKSLAEWDQRREQIRGLLIKYFIGTFPEKVPKIMKTEMISEVQGDKDSIRRRITITLATPNRASFDMDLWSPRGEGPFPLLLTAPRFYQRYWAEDALDRGYAVCLFPGVDSHHREENYPGFESVWQKFRDEYPGSTWTEISTKGWLASRCIDYLLSEDSVTDIDPSKVAIIGFSRYGKQAMIAAAFDPRISCVVARSPGSPASCPYRFTSRNTFAEAPSDFPSQWFLPSLRKYIGRENQLPIDAHGWYALIAPRHCLIHTAHNDGAEPTFAVEKAYIEGRSVYRFLGAANQLRVDYREGGHSSGPPPESISRDDRQRNLNWIDFSFGRGKIGPEHFPEELIHDFDWKEWRSRQKGSDILVPLKGSTLEKIRWTMGLEPDEIINERKADYLSDKESDLMTHDRWVPPGILRAQIRFGHGVRGNLYYKEGSKGPLPVVVWLHPLSYHSGYNEGYGVQGTTVYHRLAQNGFAVIAYDQCGFGLRLLEGRDFYSNYPQWSRLGRMVMDAKDAVSFAIDPKGNSKVPVPAMDKERIFLLGYSTGSLVAMHAGAQDPRVTGVACFSGWSPLKDPSQDKVTGGNWRLWGLHALQPKLRLFDGHEKSIPYDYDTIFRLIMPRPMLLVTPKRNRFANHGAIADLLRRFQLKDPDGYKDSLTWLAPDDVDRFQKDQQMDFINWVRSLN